MAAASNRGLEARLTRKVGPLPVWAWAASIIAAYLLYTKLRPASSQTGTFADTPANPADTTAGDGSPPASGQGGAVDNLSQGLLDQLGANTASIDALTSQILQGGFGYAGGDAFGDPAAAMPPGAPPGSVSQAGPASSPSQPNVTTGAVAAPHQTQTTAGVLSWGGINFTSRGAFDRWASQHGTSSAKIFKTHPQAKQLYGTLKP